MKDIKITVIRHGQSVANKANLEAPNDRIFGGSKDYPMSSEGLEEAEVAREIIKNRGYIFNKIFSSNAKRALDTANIITGPNQEIEIVSGLNERGLGRITGKKASEVKRELPELGQLIEIDPELLAVRQTFDNSEYNWIGAESYADVIERLKNTLGEKLEKMNHGEHAMVAAHKHTIRCLIHWLLDKTKEDETDTLSLSIPNCHPIDLEHKGGRWSFTEDDLYLKAKK